MAVFLRKYDYLAMIVAHQPQLSPDGDPSPVVTVANDRTNAAAVKQLDQIISAQVFAVHRDRFCQREAGYRAIVVQHRQSRIRTDQELILDHTGGVDHIRRQIKALEQIGKLVRNDLHHSLAGRSEPEIAQVVHHHTAHAVVHGQVLQQVEFIVFHITDAVGGADPQLAVDARDHLHRGQRLDIDLHNACQRVSHPGAAERIIHGLHIDHPRFIHVRIERADSAGDRVFTGGDIALQPAVLKRHDIAQICEPVDQPIGSHCNVTHVRLGDQIVLQHGQVVIRVNGGDAAGGGDVDRTVLILGNGPGMSGFHAIHLSPKPKLSLIHDRDAVVIGTHPKPIPAVHMQAFDAGNTPRGVQSLKGIAVIPDQAGIAADPDKTLAGLGNGVRFGGWKAVDVVVQHRGVTFGLSF